MITWLAVAIGSAMGGMARYGFGMWVGRIWGNSFPLGTLLINIIGSFVIGLFGALTVASGPYPASALTRTFVMVGLCGGFTTFSSFSLQSMELLQAGENLQAALYIVSSVAICLASVFLGYWLATRLGLPPHTEV
jgi:CrcB protein